MDEFTTRHSTIADRIQKTYRLGNKMVDFLEKQVILDFHFRGEQDVLEKNHPALKDKAVKYLGPTFYYDLSPTTGQSLPKDDPMYSKLMDMYKRLETAIEKDLKVPEKDRDQLHSAH